MAGSLSRTNPKIPGSRIRELGWKTNTPLNVYLCVSKQVWWGLEMDFDSHIRIGTLLSGIIGPNINISINSKLLFDNNALDVLPKYIS